MIGRIVILARKLDPGGAERQLVALSKGLARRGHDVHIVLFYSGGVFDENLLGSNVHVVFLDKTSRWDIMGFLVRLMLTLRELRPSLVYSFLDVPNIIVGLLRYVIGNPKLVWSIRAAGMEMGQYDWLSRSVSWLEARLSGMADMIIANSHAGAIWARQRGFPSSRIEVVENGIDTTRFNRDADGGEILRQEWDVTETVILIGIVARLDPMKDHPTFLRACALLAENHKKLMFVCVGSGSPSYEEKLRILTNDLGMADRVIWAGARQDMSAVYSSFDICCLSSAFGEGFPNVVGEAMACGVPCVVTDVGDAARIVDDLGVVVQPRDPDALARGIDQMLNRIRIEPNIPILVRESIEKRFSLDNMLMRTEKLLQEL